MGPDSRRRQSLGQPRTDWDTHHGDSEEKLVAVCARYKPVAAITPESVYRPPTYEERSNRPDCQPQDHPHARHAAKETRLNVALDEKRNVLFAWTAERLVAGKLVLAPARGGVDPQIPPEEITSRPAVENAISVV